MMRYSQSQHNLLIHSMGGCHQNDATTIPELARQRLCVDYHNESWPVFRQPESEPPCDRRAYPDIAARSYKFSLVFQNADCDYWVDMRLQTAWSSGSIVVFMGTKRKLLEEFVPEELLRGMLFAEDHDTPERLVDEMVRIAQNEADYKRRMEWTSGYSRKRWDRAFHGNEHVLCQLCRLWHDNELADGRVPPRNSIQPDHCTARKRTDWLRQ